MPTAAPPRKFNVVNRDRLKDRIYAELKQALLTGKFAPGEPVSIAYLTEEMGASIMPVRESVQRLVAEGALVNLPNGRVRVPQFTRAEFDEIYEVRVRLEGFAAAKAAKLMDAEGLQRLNREMKAIAEGIAGNEPEKLILANERFHFEIYRTASASNLLSIISSLWLRVSPLLIIPFRAAPKPRAEYVRYRAHHMKLLEALKEGNSRIAEKAMTDIIRSSGSWYHEHYRFADDEA